MTSMNAISYPQPAPSRTSVIVRPELSTRLAYIIERFTEPPTGIALPEAMPQDRDEARRVLPLFEARAATPISHDRLMTWLRPIAAGVRNPPTPDDHKAFVQAAMIAFKNTPAAAFTVDSLAAVMRGSAFFPSIADIEAVIRPVADRITAEAAALRRIADMRSSNTAASSGEPPEDWSENAIEQRIAKLECGPRDAFARAHARALASSVKRMRPDLLAAFNERLVALQSYRT